MNPPFGPPAAVLPGTKLESHQGNDKAWVWSTVDFSEGEQKVELFCLRFGTAESESTRPRGLGSMMRTGGGFRVGVGGWGSHMLMLASAGEDGGLVGGTVQSCRAHQCCRALKSALS